MTYHGSPRDTIANEVKRTIEQADKRIARKRYVAKLVRGKGKGFRLQKDLTVEEKMKIPAYAAAVAFNQKHGIGIRGAGRNGGHYIGGHNPAARFKTVGVTIGRKKVTLPKITMPIVED